MTVYTLQEKAEYFRNQFETRTRDNGEKFWCLKDEFKTEDHDSRIENFIREDLHNSMFPDDYKYEYVVDALDLISEYEDFNDINCEPDIYTQDLFKWAASHSSRQEMCNDIISECNPKSIEEILAYAQQREREEVLHLVKEFLDNIDSDYINLHKGE